MQTATIERGSVRHAPERWHIAGRTLSEDDLSIIRLFADGLCMDQIARQMYMSERTVRRRSRSLCDTLGVQSIIQVVAWAARRRLI